jgi:hypothetical protein
MFERLRSNSQSSCIIRLVLPALSFPSSDINKAIRRQRGFPCLPASRLNVHNKSSITLLMTTNFLSCLEINLGENFVTSQFVYET